VSTLPAPAVPASQLELAIERERSPDRNAERGGRSFYFFDFDDNVAFLATPVFLFHKATGLELEITSVDFAKAQDAIGRTGPYADYRIDFCDLSGTFRRFRDRDPELVERLAAGKQAFVEDLAAALGFPDLQWKGPSWSCFYHAAYNQRPLALITARGHKPDTIREGIELFVRHGHLPATPNYLGIYPVMNKAIRAALGDSDLVKSVPELKKAAIRIAVERAIEIYGASPYHRFGMSDDDPQNIELIAEEMTSLKQKYPEMSFFVIETQEGKFVKWEVYADRLEATLCAEADRLDALEQLAFFDR
jgi:hypothetical protein